MLYSHGTNYYTTCAIWKVNFDGSGYVQLTPESLPNNATFIASPDTSKILYCDGTGNSWDIWIMDADGSNKTQLTFYPARDYLSNTRDNIWSTDGQSFYFVSDRSGNGDIYQLNVDGTNLIQITSHDSLDYLPYPLPDGTKLAFISRRDGVNNIGIIDFFPVGWIQQNSGTTSFINGVYFVNTNVGIAVGTDMGIGTIHRTTDGGLNWNSQSIGGNIGLESVFFSDESNGWICGWYGTIFNTTDSGITWVQQASGTTNNLWNIYFINSNIGWMVGNGGTILKTTNGGQNWFNEWERTRIRSFGSSLS